MEFDSIEKTQSPNTNPMPDPTNSWFFRYKTQLISSLILLAIAVGALAVYLVYFRNNDTNPEVDDARLTVIAPEQTVSGSEINYQIEIKNISGTRLNNVSLQVFYPEGFDYLDYSLQAETVSNDQSAQVTASESSPRVFEFSSIGPGDTLNLYIVGVLQGSIQELKTMSARLRYEPENFRSTFEIESSALTEILAPNLVLDIEGPAQVYAGQQVEYELSITNASDKVFDEIYIEIPDSRSLTFPDKDDDKDSLELLIPRILPDQTISQRFKVKFESGNSGEVVLRVEMFQKDGEDDKLSAGRSFVFVEVLPPPIVLTHSIVNNFSNQGDYLSSGDRVRYRINYENRSDLAVENLVVNFHYDPSILSLGVNSTLDGGQKTGGQVQWTPAANPELRTVNAGQKGVFEFEGSIRQDLAEQGIENPINLTSVDYISSEFDEIIFGGQEIQVNVVTDLELEVSRSVLSNSDGRDRVQIVFRLKNSVNTVEQTIVTARIPSLGTEFDFGSLNPSEQSQVNFDSNSGLLRWNLGRVSAFTGYGQPSRVLDFEILSSDQVLLSEIEASGVDSFVGEAVSAGRIPDLRK